MTGNPRDLLEDNIGGDFCGIEAVNNSLNRTQRANTTGQKVMWIGYIKMKNQERHHGKVFRKMTFSERK